MSELNDYVKRREQDAYHNPSSERANLLDGSRGPLLEAYAVDLGPVRYFIFSYSVFRPMPAPSNLSIGAWVVGS